MLRSEDDRAWWQTCKEHPLLALLCYGVGIPYYVVCLAGFGSRSVGWLVTAVLIPPLAILYPLFLLIVDHVMTWLVAWMVAFFVLFGFFQAAKERVETKRREARHQDSRAGGDSATGHVAKLDESMASIDVIDWPHYLNTLGEHDRMAALGRSQRTLPLSSHSLMVFDGAGRLLETVSIMGVQSASCVRPPGLLVRGQEACLKLEFNVDQVRLWSGNEADVQAFLTDLEFFRKRGKAEVANW